MESVVLQFGEVANGSLVHLWNYFGIEKEPIGTENLDSPLLESIKRKFYGKSQDALPRTLIYGQRLGLKSIISQRSLNAASHGNDSLEQEIKAAEEAVFETTGRWTDFNYCTTFGESSYREVSEFNSTASFLSTFYEAQGPFCDLFEEDVRRIVEKCDWVGSFSFVSESDGAVGALTLHALQHLNDEFGKQEKIVVTFGEGVEVENSKTVRWKNSHEDSVCKAIRLSLINSIIREQKVSWMPLAPFSRAWPFGSGNDVPSIQRFCASIFYDLFGAQSVPGRGLFAALKVFTPTKTLDLFSGTNSVDPLKLPSWRQTPLPTASTSNYGFELVDLVSLADFSQSPFIKEAQRALGAISSSRIMNSKLRLSSVKQDDIGGQEYFDNITESLHQLIDSQDVGVEFD